MALPCQFLVTAARSASGEQPIGAAVLVGCRDNPGTDNSEGRGEILVGVVGDGVDLAGNVPKFPTRLPWTRSPSGVSGRIPGYLVRVDRVAP